MTSPNKLPGLRSTLFAACSIAALGPLTGCLPTNTSAVVSALNTTTATSTTTTSAPSTDGVTLHGTVQAGVLPLVGAHVYLYIAGSSGYGSASTSMLDTSASGIASDAAGNGFVVTDSNGAFTGAIAHTCPSTNSEAYLLATGGSTVPATGSNNSAIALLVALGPCEQVTATATILVNEVTTAASVTALQQFMVDSTHIGTTATNASGMANAFLTVADLADIGQGRARTANVQGTGVLDPQRVNVLADILAPCTATAAATSGACTGLFSTVSASNAPTDTAAAMLAIAQTPGNRVAQLFAQIQGVVAFQPVYTSAPNDFSLGITYSGGGLGAPHKIAIDTFGNAWTANCASCSFVTAADSIVGLSPRGVVLTGTNGLSNGIHSPSSLAFDTAGNLWSANDAKGSSPDEILKTSTSGAIASGFPFSDSTLGKPFAIALDSTGNAWVSNPNANNLVRISATGTRSLAPVTAPGFARPLGVAIDGNGLIFAAGNQSSSILKFDTNGTILSGAGAGYSTAGLSYEIGVAIDSADNLWAFNDATNSISELSASGVAISPSTGFTANISQTTELAIDGAGTAWVANCQAGCPESGSVAADNILHLAPNGNLLTASPGLQNPGLTGVMSAAIDGSGNLWIANSSGASVTELIGVAAPVRTPLALAAANNQIGVRP